jgi:Cof subfamily protein (haloacid dehalogenase superfamily)
MPIQRLLALDLDGTLFRADGTIDPRDISAVKRAMRAGVTVTIATGRLATGALPTARMLGLTDSLVCADGSVTVCARTGERLEQQPIALSIATRAMKTFTDLSLAPFILTHSVAHCDEVGRSHTDWVSVWTDDVRVHPRMIDSTAWHTEGEIAFTVGIGPQDRVESACAHLDRDHGEHIEVVAFRMSRPGDRWALLARPRGASKGATLARIANKLGVARENACAVGDWFNDVSMLEWAGRSFAMGQAPRAVQSIASDVLSATSASGGGVAEAITRWLGPESA